MASSPVRHPAFCLLCIAALSGAVASREQNPVESLVIEKIETRYVADRAACQALIGPQRRDCKAFAELRYDVALGELERLSNEPATLTPDHRPEPLAPANVALSSGAPSL